MAIQPVDLQLMLNRSTEINHTTNQNQRYDAQQQNFNFEFQQHIEQRANQTNEVNKSEGEEIKDGQGRNKGKYKGSKKDEKKEDKKVKKNKSNSLFDVSI